MSDKKSLLIGFAGSDKTVQKTLTNIKQDAPPIALKAFAEKLGTLSNDTVESLAVVERTEIVNPPKIARTLTVSTTQITPNSLTTTGLVITLTYDGPWQAVTFSGKKYNDASFIQENGVKQFTIKRGTSTPMTETGDPDETLTVTLPADNLYAEATATLTWHNFGSDKLVNI